MNAQELINIITPSDILTLMNDLGADLVKETNEYFIFTSICHGSDSSKLYYYFTKRFYCYSNCGSMDIYELIMRVKDCDFKNAFNYLKSIVSGYNRPIVGFGGRQFKSVDLDDEYIDISKTYRLAFVDKAREGSDDKKVLLLELNGNTGEVSEKCWVDNVYTGQLSY